VKTLVFSQFRLFSADFKKLSKNEMNFKKERKTERNREKTKENGVYLKFGQKNS